MGKKLVMKIKEETAEESRERLEEIEARQRYLESNHREFSPEYKNNTWLLSNLEECREVVEKCLDPLNALGHHGAEIGEYGQPYEVCSVDISKAQECFGEITALKEKMGWDK